MRPAPPTLVATRRAVHAVAEWILAPARYAVTGRIGLRPTPGGFGTPPLPDGRVLRIDGATLVDERPDGNVVHPLTTLRELAIAVGVPEGTDTATYPPLTAWTPGVPLDVDPDAVAFLGDWFAFTAELLDQLRLESTDGTEVQLWPEHFDLATVVGDEAAGRRVNLGASPGDDDHPLPYLYVGPWTAADRPRPYWNEVFGASFDHAALLAEADQPAAALAFLRYGRDHA